MTQANTKEDEKLFAQISNAVRDQKFDDLDTLVTSPQDDKKEEEDIQKVETPAEDEPEVETPDDDKKPDDKSDDDDTPADDAKQPEKDEEVDDKETPAESDEQVKLKEALELIEKVKKENHTLRSQAGRVPHLQRQVQQFDKKLEELKKLTTSPSSRPSAKLQEKINSKLAGIREADPILADALAELLADTTDGVAEDLRNAEIESLQTQRAATVEEYRQAEINRLLEMYPNAPEVFKSPSWKQWEENQSERMKTFARSDNADDVSFAFEKYAEDMAKLYPELVKKPETKEPEPKEANDKAAKIEAERLRKKENAVVVGSPNAAGRQQKPDNDEALFEQFSKQIRKEISG